MLAFIYIIFSYRIFRKSGKAIFNSSPRKSSKVNWPQKFITILTALIIAWSIVLSMNAIFFDFAVSHLTYYPLWIVIASFLIWISYECFFQPDIVFVDFGDVKANKLTQYTRNLSNYEIENYSKSLKKLMESEKPYLNPSLKLGDLAEQLHIKPKDLTVVLNHGLNKNFYDFLNQYRIHAAKEKLLDPAYDHLTILAIAYESGFNSKSSFNSIFKKSVQLTPKEFKNLHCLNGNLKNGNRSYKRENGFHQNGKKGHKPA